MEEPLDWHWIEIHLLPQAEEIRRRFQESARRELDFEDASDLVQDALLKVVQGIDLPRVRDPQRLLHAVTYNLLIDRIRHRRTLPMAHHEELEGIPSPSPGPYNEVVNAEELQALMVAFRGLPQPWRQTLVLRRFWGLSQVETARYLRISEHDVENHMKRSLARLKQLFRNGG